MSRALVLIVPALLPVIVAAEHAHPHPTPAVGKPDLWSKPVGSATLRLTDLSVITTVAAGASSGDEHELEWTQPHAHDPNRDGFTFQYLELSIAGAVDPYFRAESHVIATPDGLELEEAFAATTSLPHGLEIEAGYMFTEFGRYNPQHPHVWNWVDAPLVTSVLLSAENMRDVGARVGWLLPTSWHAQLHFTVQNGDDATMTSFLGEGHGHGEEEEEAGHGGGRREISGPGDLLYAARLVQGFGLGEDSELHVGVSLAHGPNGHDEHTLLGGIDTVVKWYRPGAPAGAGRLAWTTELVLREVGADEADEETSDWGLVSEVVYGFRPRWEAGLRVDLLDLEEPEEEGAQPDDEDEEEEPAPAEQLRLSALLGWMPSEFSKLRLQYSYAEPDDGDEVHSVWLGLEVLIGSHPAHAGCGAGCGHPHHDH